MTVWKFLTWWDYLQVAPQPPWWWKLELNNPRWKLSICATLIAISNYLEANLTIDILLFFLHYGSKILHKQSQVILTKNEGVTAIFPNFDFIWNRENQRHAFIFAWGVEKLQVIWDSWFILICTEERQEHEKRGDSI